MASLLVRALVSVTIEVYRASMPFWLYFGFIECDSHKWHHHAYKQLITVKKCLM